MLNKVATESPRSIQDSRRSRLLARHPIVEREYTLVTPMLRTAYAVARERVWTRRTGVVFYGPPRIGKTKCAEEIRQLLLQEFKTIHATVAYARRSSHASDGHLFRLILEAYGHVLATRTSPDLLFRNAVTHVELMTAKQKGKQFVLIFDEMHLLNDTDLQQLVVFHNALASKGIKMTTLSFAQPEILHRRTALMTAKQSQIIARFFSEPIKFEGCCCPEDLKDLLKGYDEHSDFPEGSGCSYTKFFVPIAFSHEFRLHHHAPAIWKELEMTASHVLDDGIPMEHVCLVIEHILLSARNQDCANYTLSSEEIVDAVASSNLENHCHVT